MNFAEKKRMQSALAFAMSAQGIPIMYYGTEQLFNGGQDPDDREDLWHTNLQKGEMYDWVATLNKARTDTKWWQEEQVERWCDDHMYSFTRGTTLTFFSNDYNGDRGITINYHSYNIGDVLQNIWNPSDQVTVTSAGIHLVSQGGMPKIYKLVNSEEFI